jgi:2-polyprenyl-6-methoxyphenol hydroxylase-like FAD-dependent oxidoreductase
MLPKTADVAIVGAGPTGLVLANQLAMQGVDFVIFDRWAQHENTSRAAVVHARSLENLRELDVSARLVERGVQVPRFTVRDRDRPLLTIDFSRLPTKYPYTLMVPQSEIESVLETRLGELGHEVHRRMELRDLVQNDDSVWVKVAEKNGEEQQIQAKYVVGADGLHSLVRDKAGIAFEGGTYEQSFILADVVLDWRLDPHEVMLFFSPEGLVVVAPLPHGRHRIVATVDVAPEHPSISDVQAIVEARGPASPQARVKNIVWSSRFRVQHRVARQYQAARLLIAGDAAHVHSPAGGQGMNTGIQDACFLGPLLSAVLRNERSPNALDEYTRLRRPVAQGVVGLTDRLTRVATMQGQVRRSLRNAIIRFLDHIPKFKRNLALRLAELK